MAVMKGIQPASCKETPPADARDKIDDKMWELMDQCWSQKPEIRPTCRKILEELECQGVGQRSDESQDYVLPDVITGADTAKVDLNQIHSVLDEVRVL